MKENPTSSGEIFCSAQDSCLEANDWNSSICTNEKIKTYEHPGWVAGNCNN